MSGNTIGRLFTVTTFGESHGPAMGCIVDGCPPGLALSEADLQQDVDRRRTGTSHFVSQRREADQVRILSGVFEGRTTGTPIGLLIENTDARSRDYDKIKDRFRPGSRRLHLSAEVRHARLPRRRPLLGARDGDAHRRRRDRAPLPRAAPRRAHLRLPEPGRAAAARAASIRPSAYQNPFFCPDPRAHRRARGADLAGARRRRLDRRARHGGCERRAARARRAGVRPARRRHRPRAHEHQRGEGGGDRRRRARRGAARQRASRRADARRDFAATTPAGCSAASPRVRT